VPTGGGGWLTAASNLDTDAQTRVCFRTSLGTSGGSNNIQPCCQGIWAASIFDVGSAEFTGNNNYMSNIHIPIPYNTNGIRTMTSGNQVDYRWDSDHIVTWDAFLSWALSGGLGGEAKLRAQLWDATVICDSFTGDATTTFDSKNWIAVTDVGTWTLFLVIP
jgi:hypothetical protein